MEGKERTKVYFESYGCTSNRFDLEVMMGLLLESGYEVCKRVDDSDVVVVNTCGVKGPTEDRILWRLGKLSRLEKPLVIAGCLPLIDFPAIQKAANGRFVALSPRSVDKISEAVELALKTGYGSLVSLDRRFIKPSLPKVRLNPVVEPLQVAEGCLGTCTFCCVRFARGRLLSYPTQIIVDRSVSAVAEGVKEVWLTAQDVGAYGSEIGTGLPALLEKVCGVEGQFFVRVGMINPNHALRLGEPLIESFKHRKVFKFLHAPVQSGNNSVLKDMNRTYTVEGFRSVVESFSSKIPDMTVATDIICGFPSESRDAFEDSIALVEDLKIDVVNVSRFFPRPGTVTSRMKQLPIEEIEQRSREMSELARRMSLERNRRWQDWKGTIIIDEKGRSDSWIGRNHAYKPIVVRSSDNLLGETVNVVVRVAHPTYLEAEICE